MTITTMTTTYDERPATTTMTQAGSPQLEAFARCLIARVLLRFPIAPGVSVRTYVALLIKWRSVLRIFTAAPMRLTPECPPQEAPAAEPVGECPPPPSPTGGASPTTPPDPSRGNAQEAMFVAQSHRESARRRVHLDELGVHPCNRGGAGIIPEQSQSRERRPRRAAASRLAVMWAPITDSERPVSLQLWDPAPATLGALSESPFVGAPDAVTLQGPPWPPYWHLQTPARPASFHRRRRRRRRRRRPL